MIKILGGDQQQVAEQVEEIIRQFLTTNDALSVSRLAGETVNLIDLKDELSASSLFNPERLIVVRDFNRCPDLKLPPRDKGQDKQKFLASMFEGITSTNQLLVTISSDAASSPLITWLRKQPSYQEYKPLTSQDLANWLIGRAKDLGSRLDRPTAGFLVDYYGHDGVGLATEIIKLSLHAGNYQGAD